MSLSALGSLLISVALAGTTSAQSAAITGRVVDDVIAEVFNLFNASNPSAFNARRVLGSVQNPVANPDFLQPASFAGDFQRPEQRVVRSH